MRPILVDFYEQYRCDQDTSAFVEAVERLYQPAALERIAEIGGELARRAAVLALGLVGDYRSNAVLGRRLVDSDRTVRTFADEAIRNVWRRVGTRGQRDRLLQLIALVHDHQFGDAIVAATKLVHEAPWFAEAWNQRAIAYFHSEEYEPSIRDCHEALEINAYHFVAAAGLGQCYLKLRDQPAALSAFRRALRLNPSLEHVRARVTYLQRVLPED